MSHHTTHPAAIGLLAGTFDPIHRGHLGIAAAVWQAIPLQAIEFLPNHCPPHRATPQASADHRAKMISLAIANVPHYHLNRTELDRPGLSYLIDTLALLKAGPYASQPLCLILGEDSFLSLTTWHRWAQLMDYCHLIVVARPHYATPDPMTDPQLHQLWTQHRTQAIDHLQNQSPTVIVHLPHTTYYETATAIRHRLKAGQDTHTQLPAPVQAYIQHHRLYK